MTSQNERAHGVTPALSRDYAARTAEQQAAFVLPYLRPGMNLLDVGCGPGTITLGLAQAVAPGQVTGIDHDPMHVQVARAKSVEQEVDNVSFQMGNAPSLPFADATFDAAFENNMLTHLAQDAVCATREVYRLLKPGGFFAARDVDAEAVVWGHWLQPMKQLDRLFIAWHESRGSDITIGKRLPAILREAGFRDTVKSVSADTKGDPEATRSHAEITVSLLDGPFGRDIVENGWADRATVEELKESMRKWGNHPDAFFANVHVESIGWKPAPTNEEG
jgi:ubiquinone/menaquinone biosynthesis C-methylase UbiE